MNLNGQVIGINTAISSSSGGNDGIGFAIPVNLAKWVGKQLVADGKVSRAYLGVGIQPVTADLAKKFHVEPREGVLISGVRNGGPAHRQGIEAGAIITHVNHQPIESKRMLQTALQSSSAQDGVLLSLRTRSGSRFVVLKN